NNNTGSNNDGPGSRGRGHPCAATSSRRNSDGGARAWIRLDNRLLAMDGNHVCVGAGDLGSPPKTGRSLGGRPLGAALQRLGMGPWTLAVTDTAENRHQPRTFANMRGATIVASDSIINFGVSTLSFPHVIFSLGTAPEYDPKLVVGSLIWQTSLHSGTGSRSTSWFNIGTTQIGKWAAMPPTIAKNQL